MNSSEPLSPMSYSGDLSGHNRDLFRLWRIPFNNETDPEKRIKALNCLYGIAQLSAHRVYEELHMIIH